MSQEMSQEAQLEQRVPFWAGAVVSRQLIAEKKFEIISGFSKIISKFLLTNGVGYVIING